MKTGDARVEVEVTSGIAHVRLRRPEKANAIDLDMAAAVADAVDALSANRSLRALVLSGEGRSFSGGVDLVEFDEDVSPPERREAFLNAWERMIDAIRGTPFVSLARIHGPAIAGGLSLALAADVRIASPHASFGYPRIPDGNFPGQFNVSQLVRRIGPARTRVMILAGRIIPAETAYQWGLVDVLTAQDDLDDVMASLLTEIGRTPRDLGVLTNGLIEKPALDETWREAERLHASNDTSEVDAFASRCRGTGALKPRSKD
jgi:enoyl-CoA hydratase